MWEWLRRLVPAKQPPLTGAPTVRRQKSYSAQSGFVYQYFYTGSRAAERSGAVGTQYVFEISADRKQFFPVSVFVEAALFSSWEESRARALGANERYAVAKITLFQAFDERESPSLMKEEIAVRARDLTLILESLGIE